MPGRGEFEIDRDVGLHPGAGEAIVEQFAVFAGLVGGERALRRLGPRDTEQVADGEVAEQVLAIEVERCGLVDVHRVVVEAQSGTVLEVRGQTFAVDLAGRLHRDEGERLEA